jgi:hypothetical protein
VGIESDRLESGEAWRQWCDRLKAVGDRILESDFPSDERTRAEGYRALTRLIASALRSEVEGANSDFPEFIRDQGPRSPWGGANPDVVTLRAPIDPKQTYKIWADVDGMFQATFCQHEGSVALDRSHLYYERHLESFVIDEDGFLELILSPDEHDGNWMPAHADARFFTIRIIVSDWESHTAPTFHIERVGAEGEAPPPPSAAHVASGLDRSAEWIEKSSTYWPRYAREISERLPVNIASELTIDPGDPSDLATGRCFWDLAEDEALLITCEVPIAQYWGFAIQTMSWFESGDFARRQTSLSGDQIHLDEDGLARLVLSAQDPGVPNWIDTEGRSQGLLAYRFGWAETLPIPEIRLVETSGVYNLLPDDHPVLTEDERRDRLSLRREALWNRFG